MCWENKVYFTNWCSLTKSGCGMTYIPWMIDTIEVAPLGQVWETQMWSVLTSCKGDWRLWEFGPIKDGHTFREMGCWELPCMDTLGEGARRQSQRHRLRKSGESKNRLFYWGYEQASYTIYLPRSHWLRLLTLLHYSSLIGFSCHVSLRQQSLGLVAGPRIVQGESSRRAGSSGLVWARRLWLG